MTNASGPLRVDATPDPELKTSADGDFSVPSYDIAPEDQHIADAVMAMDLVRDVPSPFRGFEGVKQPELTLATLPPELRESVEKQLVYVPASKRGEAERTLVRAALEHNSKEVRLRAGVGEGALPFHKVAAELDANHRLLARQFDSISERLAEVERYDVRSNPTTGERETVPVYAVQGAARQMLAGQQADLNYRMKLLEGIEGERQMKQALHETVELLKQRNAMVAEEREVQTRAEQLVRERRISKRAEARARTIAPEAL